MRIVFWQDLVSFHQSALLRALAEAGHEVLLVAPEALPGAHRTSGWHVPDIDPARVVLAPGGRDVVALAATEVGRTIHVIGGRGGALTAAGLRACRRAGARLVLLREGADPRGSLGLMRSVMYRREQMTLGGSVAGVLAIGRRGVSWYRACGWPPAVVLPFAYFAESPADEAPFHPGGGGTGLRILFIGQLIRRKGLDLLLRALRDLGGFEWRLAVIGDGPARATYLAQARHDGLAGNVDFLGVLPNRQAMSALTASDLLVLPSRHDGWGMVVGEALVRGVPAICSDRCGAADLLAEGWRGGVFPGDDVRALGEALEKRMRAGRRTAPESARISSWAQCLAGASGARYMVGALDHLYAGGPPPAPPWSSEAHEVPGQPTKRPAVR